VWPFRRSVRRTVEAEVRWQGEAAVVDVRGQTCPGYLLAIDRAVAALPQGTRVELLISYPPCGADVRTWCRERRIRFQGLSPQGNHWRIHIRK